MEEEIVVRGHGGEVFVGWLMAEEVLVVRGWRSGGGARCPRPRTRSGVFVGRLLVEEGLVVRG